MSVVAKSKSSDSNLVENNLNYVSKNENYDHKKSQYYSQYMNEKANKICEKRMSESDYDYDELPEEKAVTTHMTSANISYQSSFNQASSMGEEKELVFKKHIMRKFSEFKRLTAELHPEENKANESADKEESPVRKKVRRDLGNVGNEQITSPSENETSKASLSKSFSSRSSFSSNESTSSGIGSSNGNIGSEGCSSENRKNGEDVNFSQGKSVSSQSSGLDNNKEHNKSPNDNYDEENDIECDINSSEDVSDRNIDLSSNYDAENEDYLGISGSDDDRVESHVKEVIAVEKRDKSREKTRMFIVNGRGATAVYEESNKNADLVNNLLRTMNEILTNQLVLTRKVESVNEKFSKVDRRLKEIEFCCVKPFKKHRLHFGDSSTKLQANIRRNARFIKREPNVPFNQQTVLKSSERSIIEVEQNNSPQKDEASSKTTTFTNRQTNGSGTLSKGTVATRKESEDTDTKKSQTNTRETEPKTNKSTANDGSHPTASNNPTNQNHILSISNLTESFSKQPANSSFLPHQQPEHMYSPLKHTKQGLHSPIAKCNSVPFLASSNRSESSPPDTPLFSGSGAHKSNRLLDLSMANRTPSFIEQHQHLLQQHQTNTNRLNSHSNVMKHMSLGTSSLPNNMPNKLGNSVLAAASYPYHSQANSLFAHQLAQHSLDQEQHHLQQQQQQQQNSARPSQPQIPHLLHAQGSHPGFGHSFLQGSLSSPSNLVVTSTNKGSVCSKEGVASSLPGRNLGSSSVRSHVGQHAYDRSDSYGKMENEENDYDSGEEEEDVSGQQRETLGQAASFIVQQHGLVRHVPSGSVDQLDLDEETEALVSRDVIKRCVRKAKHRGNFAANLAAELFSKEERVSCNCTGTRGKRQLSPRRLNLVKDITFRMYSTNQAVLAAVSSSNASTAAVAAAAMNAAYHDFEEAWRKECITAIDAKNRSIGRDLVKASYGNDGASKSSHMNKENVACSMDMNTMSPGEAPFSDSNSINVTDQGEN